MKLSALDPQWLKATSEKSWRRGVLRAEANGVLFLCPKCYAANGGPVGTHSVICWAPDAPEEIRPAPGRWEMAGDSFDTLTLHNPGKSNSVQLLGGGCMAHFFVENGSIRMA